MLRRVLSTPRDPALRVQTLEVTHQQQTKVPARTKTRTAHPLRIELRALRLHQLVETAGFQNAVHRS